MSNSRFTLLLASAQLLAVIAMAADPPRELTSLKESYLKARQQALAPIDKKYVDALTSLKTRFTKEGNLAAALEIDEELKSVSASSTPSRSSKAELAEILPNSVWEPERGSKSIWKSISFDNEGKIIRTSEKDGVGTKVDYQISKDGKTVTFQNPDGSAPALRFARDLKSFVFGAATFKRTAPR